MDQQKPASSIVCNADGVEFTIYKSSKPTKSGTKCYWVLADQSSGHRRLLNNKTLAAAKQRAHKIRTAMVKGQADRLALSSAQWQRACVAIEVVRSFGTGVSLYTVAQEYGICTGILSARPDQRL